MTMIGGNNGGGPRPQGIPIAPVPTNIIVGQGQGMWKYEDGHTALKMFLVLGFQTAQGQNTFLLDPVVAEESIRKAVEIIELSKAGLTYGEGM